MPRVSAIIQYTGRPGQSNLCVTVFAKLPTRRRAAASGRSLPARQDATAARLRQVTRRPGPAELSPRRQVTWKLEIFSLLEIRLIIVRVQSRRREKIAPANGPRQDFR